MQVLWINVLLFALYALLPLRDIGRLDTLLIFLGGLVVFGLAVGRQVRSVVTADYPRLRAIVAIGTAIPLLIVVFSAVYVAMSAARPESFSEPVGRIGGIYFTITVLATVGFGDIVAKTEVARLVVTLQMVFDLTLVGVVFRALAGAIGRNELAAATAIGDDEPEHNA